MPKGMPGGIKTQDYDPTMEPDLGPDTEIPSPDPMSPETPDTPYTIDQVQAPWNSPTQEQAPSADPNSGPEDAPDFSVMASSPPAPAVPMPSSPSISPYAIPGSAAQRSYASANLRGPGGFSASQGFGAGDMSSDGDEDDFRRGIIQALSQRR